MPVISQPDPAPPPSMQAYIDAGRRRREKTVARVLGGLEDREQRLFREAAVMGFVLGARAGTADVPLDRVVVSEVILACCSHADNFPTTSSLAAHVSPRTAQESAAAALLATHPPHCAACGGPARACQCDAPWLCGTCALPGDVRQARNAAAWPCPPLAAAGRAAVCVNVLEMPSGDGAACDGYLIFHPTAGQARCLTCGGWCGEGVADYVTAGTVPPLRARHASCAHRRNHDRP